MHAHSGIYSGKVNNSPIDHPEQRPGFDPLEVRELEELLMMHPEAEDQGRHHIPAVCQYGDNADADSDLPYQR